MKQRSFRRDIGKKDEKRFLEWLVDAGATFPKLAWPGSVIDANGNAVPLESRGTTALKDIFVRRSHALHPRTINDYSAEMPCMPCSTPSIQRA